MKHCRILFFSLFFVSAVGQLPSPDILALLEFKKGIKHDPTGYVLESWNKDSINFNGCPSSWNGIVCNGNHVAGIVLDNLGLSASADLSVFSNLTMLVKLSMSNNYIAGKLPNNIGDFKSLEHLDISDNLFFSSLPPDIGRLRSIQSLSLAGNNFSGSIPESVSGLTSLQSLDFSCNSFSGSLPLSLTKLTSLLSLNLSFNGFTKKIPKGFELITNLKVLDLHGNMLDGNLDEEFLLLSSAIHVDFSGNLLVSSASQQQKILPHISDTIKYLNLSHNQLTGSLVSGGDQQIFGSLKVLDLSYNWLSGELPGFNFVYGLEVLKLSNNSFSGFIPNNLLTGDSLVLTELDLSCNNLTGPVSMITSTTLRILNLSLNGLSGELPLLTGSCVVLDLSKNQLEGSVTRVVNWENVEFLDLSQNHLTGFIPEVISPFLQLNYLNLSHNNLNSSLPKVTSHFPKLTVLDLSFNQLDGPILAGLLTLPTLQELHLENNLLVGPIEFSDPSSIGSRLRVLDFSHNRLNGNFPDEFGSLTSLQVLGLAGNNFSGSLPASMASINSLISLDISNNHFTYLLPNNLSNSLQSFNASFNDLSGVIPENLRKFPLSSFFPGNSGLQFPNFPPNSRHSPTGNSKRKTIKTVVRLLLITVCVLAVVIFILLAIFVHHICISRKSLPGQVPNKDIHGVSNFSSFCGEDLLTSRKGYLSEISPDDKVEAVGGFSPSKTSRSSCSPETGESFAAENLARLNVRSPDQLAGELCFLDLTISFASEELSKAPAEVLGRSNRGTSYRAVLDNGMILTVKWLREGLAKQKKNFDKEAKRFANIRHPNVVGLRGYYWGSTEHEKLILSDYISPGSLASFLYDQPGRKGPPLSWDQRLKIAVDVARGLNYLHFDRVIPHGNIKATNILLEGPEPTARVADFCQHRLMNQAGTVEQILDAGMLGYRAPELAASKKPLPSLKSDVYAFGIILLELLTGKCAGDVVSGEDEGIDLTSWVRLRVAEGYGSDCFDTALMPETAKSVAERGMKEVLAIALRCISGISERPGIKSVYEDLSSI